jgi:hypothetical protein
MQPRPCKSGLCFAYLVASRSLLLQPVQGWPSMDWVPIPKDPVWFVLPTQSSTSLYNAQSMLSRCLILEDLCDNMTSVCVDWGAGAVGGGSDWGGGGVRLG